MARLIQWIAVGEEREGACNEWQLLGIEWDDISNNQLVECKPPCRGIANRIGMLGE